MKEDNLNIDYHIRILVVKALNRTHNITKGAELLGITERTLYNYKRQYSIQFDKTKNIYY